MITPIARIVDRAIAQGILPAQASESNRLHQPAQPWPVVLLGFIGSQFAIWPILVFFGFVSGGALIEGFAPFFIGPILIGLSIALLRANTNLGFMSQVALSMLLIGDGLLVFAISKSLHDVSPAAATILVASLQLVVAFLVRLRWAQALSSALACAAIIFLPVFLIGFAGNGNTSSNYFTQWRTFGLLISTVSWAIVVCTEQRWAGKTTSETCNSIATGWGYALILAVIYYAWLGSLIWDADAQSSPHSATRFLSLGFTLASAVALLWSWRSSLSIPAFGLVALCFAALSIMSWFIPNAYLICIILSVAMLTNRKRLIALSVLALLCLLSGFYYHLSMTLVDKALLLMFTGVLLILGILIISMVSKRPAPVVQLETNPNQNWKFALPVTLLGAALCLGVSNWSIFQKEQIISNGEKLYIALTPRDPRSLMQGDYMALNFGMPGDVLDALGGESNWRRQNQDDRKPVNFSRRNTVVAKRDSRGVASVVRVAKANESIAADEVLLPVQFKNSRWALVTDAFFFPEGAGKSLEAAKFGELRAALGGQALLVGLVDADFKQLQSLPDKITEKP